MDKVIEQDGLMPVKIEKQALSNDLELHQAESIVWVENDKIPELLKKVSDLFIPEKDISNNSNSEFGSHHWLHTLMGFIKRTGSFIEQHGHSKPDDETLKKWGAQIVVFSQEILDYYTANLKASPTTPATSWEEVYKKAQEHAATIGSHGIFGEVNFTDSVEATSYYQNLINYLSQHWPSSQPVSPTPMSETWEESKLARMVIEVLENKARYCCDSVSWKGYQNGNGAEVGVDIDKVIRYAKSIIKSPSLHQVDRWVRVEDVQPQPKKLYWIYGEISTFMGGPYIGVSNEPYYWKGRKWVSKKGGTLVATITHYMPYEPPSGPLLPDAPKNAI